MGPRSDAHGRFGSSSTAAELKVVQGNAVARADVRLGGDTQREMKHGDQRQL